MVLTSKILRGSAKYLESRGGLRDWEYLMLNLPYACNYKCEKCCNSEREIVGKGDTLSSDEILQSISESKDLGMRVLVIIGEGEPLLDDRIKEIVSEADQAGLIPYVFTNGSLLDKETVSYLKDHKASLVINLDSLNKETYEHFSRTEGSFDAVLENLKIIREIFFDTHIQIGDYYIRRIAINTVVSSHNIDELSRLQDFCGDDFVPVFNIPINIGRAFNNPDFKGSEEIEKEIKHLSNSMIPLGTTSDGKWCSYMRNGISIGVRGGILACAYSLESAGSFGNIRDSNLKDCAERANSAVDEFYGTEGHSRCILRHPNYGRFIEELRNQNPPKYL